MAQVRQPKIRKSLGFRGSEAANTRAQGRVGAIDRAEKGDRDREKGGASHLVGGCLKSSEFWGSDEHRTFLV